MAHTELLHRREGGGVLLQDLVRYATAVAFEEVGLDPFGFDPSSLITDEWVEETTQGVIELLRANGSLPSIENS